MNLLEIGTKDNVDPYDSLKSDVCLFNAFVFVILVSTKSLTYSKQRVIVFLGSFFCSIAAFSMLQGRLSFYEKARQHHLTLPCKRERA